MALTETRLGGTIDVLIAITAIENDLYLLHDDRDFAAMEGLIPELKALRALPQNSELG